MSNEELQTPVSGLRVCVESVLDSTADVAAASAAPAAAAPVAQQAVSGAVPVLLLRDDSLPDGTKSVGMYVHSRLRELFCGPHAPLGPGEPHTDTCRLPSWHHRNAFTPGISDLRQAISGFGEYGHERSDCFAFLQAATCGWATAGCGVHPRARGCRSGCCPRRRWRWHWTACRPPRRCSASSTSSRCRRCRLCCGPGLVSGPCPSCLSCRDRQRLLLAPFANKRSPFCFT